MRKLTAFLLFIFMFMPMLASAEAVVDAPASMPRVGDDVRVITVTRMVAVGDDMSRSQARAAALNNARRAALEEAVGTSIQSMSLMYNDDLIEGLINTATKGLIIKETIKKEGYGDDNRNYAVELEAYVKPIKANAKSLNIIKASVQRPDKDASAINFQNRDEIQVRVTAQDDAYVSIFSVDQYGGIIKLYPNEYVETALLPSRKEFIFPNNALRGRGLKLRVTVPKNLSKALESVLIIVTKEDIPFLTDNPVENPMITDLMKELSELDDTPWGTKSIGYEVYK